ncbi:DMT family transporter [Roseococcus pinisoli]|uniref:DMT family transporter n=1 Tax=Roseococcus pinisoli TaxID=2835040 RepID=A0ABS5QIR6_9PROT|nr:DMT family transporter [Roseococcus pinisoli]MBS7813248.1 DMT family transporter [Roseococcus pinisoli]
MTAAPIINRPMTSHEWGMLIALSALWGGSFFFTDIALQALPPFTLVLLRVAGAALILNATIPLMGLRLPTDARSWVAFFGMGFLNNAVPFCLIVWGQTQIDSGLAAILNATTPLWTVIVVHFLTAEEKMTGNRLAGVVIGLIGVTVMIGPQVFDGLGATILAQLAVLGAAISYAFAALFGRRFRRLGVAPMITATGQVTASTLMLMPIALFVDHPWTLAMPGLSVWAAVLGIAALSTALAYVLYFRILATAGTTNLMLVTFLIPVSAILLGALVLGERLDTKQVIGMMLIGMALAAIDGRVMRKFRPKTA